MTGREMLEAAFSPEGSPAFAALICYQSLFLRDHWDECTDAPWWWQFEADPERAAQLWIDMARRTGQDWYLVRLGHSLEERRQLHTEASDDGVFQANRTTGERWQLARPPVSGVQPRPEAKTEPPGHGISDPGELDALMDRWFDTGDESLADDSCLDLPRALHRELGAEKAPLGHVAAPWWHCFSIWGFSELMMRMADSPELVHRACERFLRLNLRTVRQHAAAGARIVWIEDCMSDMISPAQCREFSIAYVRPIVEAIREAGMLSVHYYCGNPNDRWDLLLDSGADALSLEESKKTFDIDIMDVAKRLDGRMALLGNLDAIGVLEHGSDRALEAEVARQCAAGRLNRGRFAVSLGSPVTPDTPLERVRLYCDLVHGQAL